MTKGSTSHGAEKHSKKRKEVSIGLNVETTSVSTSQDNASASVSPEPLPISSPSARGIHRAFWFAIGGFILLGVALYFLWPQTFFGNSQSSVAATVNGQSISAEELDGHYSTLPPEYQQVVTKKMLLDQLIVETLLFREATSVGIAFSEKEVNSELEALLNQTHISRIELGESLKSQGVSEEEFMEDFVKRLTITRFLDQYVLKNISVTDREIEDYYNLTREQYEAKEGQIRARHILVATEKEAETVKAELKRGVPFADLAEQYSIDKGSGMKGGDLGFFGRGQMVKPFEDATFALKENMTTMVKTQFGYHIVRREVPYYPLKEVIPTIEKSILMGKQRSLLETYVSQLKAKADIKIFLTEQKSESMESLS